MILVDKIYVHMILIHVFMRRFINRLILSKERGICKKRLEKVCLFFPKQIHKIIYFPKRFILCSIELFSYIQKIIPGAEHILF